MIKGAYIRLVWRNHRTFALFSMFFIMLFQFLILYLVTTFDTAAILSAILDQLPPMMKAFLNDSFFSMLNYNGAAAFGLNHPIVLTLLVINAINVPAHHISGELETGTLELLLAHPFKRNSLLLSLWTAGSLIFGIIIGMALAGSCASILIFHELSGQVFIHMLQICINLWLLITLIFTYTILIAVIGKAGFRAGNMSAAVTFFFYLLFFLAQIWSAISFTNYFNIFNYYQPQKLMLGQGNFLSNSIVLLLLVMLGLGLSLRKFNSRDLP
jgi:ABC-type transport system involved in multi-copper enzyme maturation permease subunit